MGFNCGIVGLPNVGKSTLFNAITQTAAAEAVNYPFCTIEPNVGRVEVPDPRLLQLAKIASSKKIVATQIEIVDIAGLVKGASKGEGLGNQFLGHIRGTDAILHVVRCFENGDVIHVSGSVDPIRDMEIVETELMLADLESLKKREASISKKNNADLAAEKAFLEKSIDWLESGKMLNRLILNDGEMPLADPMRLITRKPVLYVCNVSENEIISGNAFTKRVEDFSKDRNSAMVVASAAIEAEIALIHDENERELYIQSLGLSESGLARVIRGGYGLLDLITFFTVGAPEAHAWTTKKNSRAPTAAGVIHTDFEHGFICAETISYDDYIAHNGESGAKAAGKMRLEGKEYLVNDGDILHFRFNV
ncbi:MAG: redox-regulated ATPase YchF [Holosporaceae bacterium]|jgi:GTP-binding protein YchF|nr:redox-regulated ATPase YchF [Holosporaceae bacterium]